MRIGLALCFGVSGATSLVLEVAWAKELSYTLGNSLHAVSMRLAAFMAGLVLGRADDARDAAERGLFYNPGEPRLRAALARANPTDPTDRQEEIR